MTGVQTCALPIYWQVRQGERVRVGDYREGDGRGVLSFERSGDESTGGEQVWSAGRRLTIEEVDAAYGIIRREPARPGEPAPRGRPLDDEPGLLSRISQGLVVLVVVVLVMLLLARCDGRDSACDAQRNTFGADSAEYAQCLREQRSGGYSSGSGGGSFGGFSSGGGGHK